MSEVLQYGDEPAAEASAPARAGVPARGEVELRAGLTSLSQILTGVVSLEDTLAHGARIAVQSIYRADGVGIALAPERRRRLAVASDPFVREIDSIQYDLVEGPGVTAVAEDRVIRSGSLASDRRWPRFAARIANLGVNQTQSVLALPLRLPGRVIGALTVFAHEVDAFDEDSLRRGEVFAAAAAVAVSNMQQLDYVQAQAAQLEEGLVSRAAIDQAIGIVRSRSGGTAEQALDSLRLTSQRENKRVAVVAERLVDQAIERARARHR